MLQNILWVIILIIISFFIFRDRKKKRYSKEIYNQTNNKELEKEMAIEKEKARRGFGQNIDPPNGGGF